MRKFRLRGVKNTPKVLEKGLLENAKRLAADPTMVIPKCSGEECRRCRFAKIEKKIMKVNRHKDDSDKLVKLAGKGDQFVRAYAAAISLAATGKVPYLTSAQLPGFGEVSFAVRGTVDKEKLISLQHFDDPDLRLLAYWEMARKCDLHIYSTEKGLYCSSNGPMAPPDYVKEMTSSVEELREDGTCGHPGNHIIVGWLSAKMTLRLCRECAGDSNLIAELSSRIAAPDHSDDFRADAEIGLRCNVKDCDKCRTKADISELAERYRKGELSDKRFLEEAEARYKKKLKEVGGLFVAGDECFGNDHEAFLKAIKGSDLEKEVLSKLIASKNVSIVSDSNIAGKIITELWPDHGPSMLVSVASSEVVFKVTEMKDLQPPQLLAEARRMELSKTIDMSLPSYTKLGDIGKVSDTLARTYKAEGKEAMMRAMDRFKGRDHRTKSVCYAFSRAVGDTSRSWQFTRQEADFGEYLEQFAKAMLESIGSDYDQALRNMVAASGSNETVQ
ncbi:MAG: hypothetical protein HPY73_06375 [Methanomassiliicoccales archaeon]|nr:MAG: hypothetical protein HPY73_06375 [Methanomassiliicoccales archaeon]